LLTISNFQNGDKECLKKLYSSDAVDSDLLNLLVCLVYVADITWLALSQN